MDQILNMASPKDLLVWIVCAALILQVILKYYPVVRGWFKKDILKETAARTVDQRLDVLEQDMKEVKAKQNRDYSRMNEMTERLEESAQDIKDSKEERQLMLSGLLAALKGLQELGTNGPTKSAQSDIEQYLNRQAHK